ELSWKHRIFRRGVVRRLLRQSPITAVAKNCAKPDKRAAYSGGAKAPVRHFHRITLRAVPGCIFVVNSSVRDLRIERASGVRQVSGITCGQVQVKQEQCDPAASVTVTEVVDAIDVGPITPA